MSKTSNKVTESNWKQLAEQAWNDCDDRKLTKAEKIALVCEALVLRNERNAAGGHIGLSIDDLSSRCCLTSRQFGAVCRSSLDKVNEILGTSYRYSGSDYNASGRGAFGRLGGGRGGQYVKPSLY